jgi:hypothetical protein
MTEQEWLASGYSLKMLAFIHRWKGMNRRKAGRRKLRLFGCSSCRRMWEQMTDERSRQAVVVAERWCDGNANIAEVEQSRTLAQKAYSATFDRYLFVEDDYLELVRIRGWLEGDELSAAIGAMNVLDSQAVNFISTCLSNRCGEELPEYPIYMARSRAEAVSLRCIFGNPFRPVRFNSTWRTPQAIALARTDYEERRFEDLPLLADALEEAGCTDAAILAHLRGPGPHVRGCWVVDLVLDKN